MKQVKKVTKQDTRSNPVTAQAFVELVMLCEEVIRGLGSRSGSGSSGWWRGCPDMPGGGGKGAV